MALRVLLADESVTIKKVFQLALQDYGVEVLTVNTGVDVIPVAQKFKPDIVFADVLLQKRSGYDVAKDLSANPELGNVPTVLIWSGFMELDQEKYQASTAKADLEKPFDANKLRSLVQKLVPKTSEQNISEFLEFPDMPEFEDDPPKVAPTVETASEPEIAAPPLPESEPEAMASESDEDTSDWSMEDFSTPPLTETPEADDEANDDFVEMNLQLAPPAEEEEPEQVEPILEEEETSWVSKTLTNFRLGKDKLKADESVTYQVPEEAIDPDSVINQQISAQKHEDTPPPSPVADDDGFELELDVEPTESSATSTELNQRQIEAIVRAEAREILEKVIWEIVPEIASQVIEREIQKLVKEQDDKL